MSTDDRVRAAERAGDKARLAVETCRRDGHRWTTRKFQSSAIRRRTCRVCNLDQVQLSRKEGGHWIDHLEWVARIAAKRRRFPFLPVPE